MPVYGPYKRVSGKRTTWRMLIVGVASGSESGQSAVSFATEEECQRQIDLARRREAKAEGTTLEQAVRAFLHWQQTRRKNPISSLSAETNGQRLRGILKLPSQKNKEHEDRPIASVDVGEARRLYRRRVDSTRGDTHLAELSIARQMWEWAIDEKICPLTRRNPWLEVESEGKKSRGKPQLRISHARHFVEYALSENTREGLAAATVLILGLRASELTSRLVGDLDDDGRVLWVPDSKTPAGVRQMGVPEEFNLRERLKALCVGKTNDQPLFGLTRKARPVDRHWLHHHIERLCKACGVPRVTTHSMRGLHTTIAYLNEVTPAVVARAVGHHHESVTKESYVAPGTIEQISVKRVSSRLTQK